MSLSNEEFVYNVGCDIEHFLKKRLSNGVLLFPPVNSFCRYLIHQACENYSQNYDLLTFSVGQGPQRRTVLCFRNQLVDPQDFEARRQQQKQLQQQQKQSPIKSWRSNGKSHQPQQQNNGRSNSGSRKRPTDPCKMGVKHISETRLSKSNSVDLYRPPALRNNSSEEASATNGAFEYIPTTTSAATPQSAPAHSNAQKQQQQQQVNAAAAARRERRPDRAVYVPRARRSQTTPPTTMPTSTPAEATLNTCNPQQLEAAVVDTNSSKADDCNNPQARPKKTKLRRERSSKKTTTAPADATLHFIAPNETTTSPAQTSPNQAESPTNCSRNCDKECQPERQINMNAVSQTKPVKGSKTSNSGKIKTPRIEDVGVDNNDKANDDATKCDNDVRELQRASKEINRSNRRIMKQTFVSDVLEIPETITDNSLNAESHCNNVTKATVTNPTDSTTEGEDDDEEDEDDWENMFDETGECLDPKILQELNEAVGKCKIELPKMDYNVYHIKHSLLNEEEFPHVLEVSNFPMEFKTPDLLMLFSQYKGTGFDIKWVDDTHALAVFSSSRIAAEVLTMGHPFVKLKPLAEATLESRLKAKKCAGSLQPYRQRPETCTALARRLVIGALGVKLPTAPQERENERRVLREAKERKLLAAKQRDEAWES